MCCQTKYILDSFLHDVEDTVNNISVEDPQRTYKLTQLKENLVYTLYDTYKYSQQDKVLVEIYITIILNRSQSCEYNSVYKDSQIRSSIKHIRHIINRIILSDIEYCFGPIVYVCLYIIILMISVPGLLLILYTAVYITIYVIIAYIRSWIPFRIYTHNSTGELFSV